jgi:CheY-like chemotaxis protein
MQREQAMSELRPITMVMVDDNIDEIFLTRRQVRKQGIVNHFVSERYSENIINTLTNLAQNLEATNVLILLDINMPRMNGFETLKRIRHNKQFGHLPVVMFSASEDELDMEMAANLGANGYMVKPFSMDALVTVLGGLPQIRYNFLQ